MLRKILMGSAFCMLLLSLQAVAADMAPTVDALSAQEKALWEAIKNNDLKTFAAGTAAEILDIDAMGTMQNKQQVLSGFAKMKLIDYQLTEFSLYTLNNSAVVLSYKANSKATMDGQEMGMNGRVTTTYINEGGKWIPKFHTETPIIEMPAPAAK